MIKVARKIITARSEICMNVSSFASKPNPSNGPKKLKNAFILKILSAKNSLASIVDLARCEVDSGGCRGAVLSVTKLKEANYLNERIK